MFESETDTEVIAKLVKYLYDSQKDASVSFLDIVKAAAKELEGAFALVFKSKFC